MLNRPAQEQINDVLPYFLEVAHQVAYEHGAAPASVQGILGEVTHILSTPPREIDPEAVLAWEQRKASLSPGLPREVLYDSRLLTVAEGLFYDGWDAALADEESERDEQPEIVLG